MGEYIYQTIKRMGIEEASKTLEAKGGTKLSGVPQIPGLLCR
jgi:hypothetical protein